jgi:hypothetical protein
MAVYSPTETTLYQRVLFDARQFQAARANLPLMVVDGFCLIILAGALAFPAPLRLVHVFGDD